MKRNLGDIREAAVKSRKKPMLSNDLHYRSLTSNVAFNGKDLLLLFLLPCPRGANEDGNFREGFFA